MDGLRKLEGLMHNNSSTTKKKKYGLTVCIIILIGASFFIPIIHADGNPIVYVWGDAPGSWYSETQVATISEGITNVSAGGTVYIWDGNYSEDVTITKSVTMIGNGTDTVTVKEDQELIVIEIFTTSHVNISKMSIDMSTASYGIGAYASSHVNLSYLTIFNMSDEQIGIKVLGSLIRTDYIISHNTIEGDSKTGTGIYIEKETCVSIYNNTIQYLDIGVNLSEIVDTFTIYNNYIKNNTYGLRINDSNDVLVYNNWFENDEVNACSTNNTNMRWNISKILGTNIVGGAYLMGNYWHDYTGTDSDGDGIGDTPWQIFECDVAEGEEEDHGPLLPRGFVFSNVWNEANTSESLVFDILITNEDGTETYLDTDCEYYVSFYTIDIPYGEKTIFIVNSDGFKQRIYYYDITLGEEYEFDFYLPPENPDPYYEQTLQTNTRAVTNPDADVVFTLGCTPRHIVSVQAWNESLYGHWYTISQDNYTLSGATLTVDNSVFDANTSLVQVNYYCLDSEYYALQYMLKVVGPQEEYGYDPPISDVLVGIKTYIERTGEWENVSRLYTDANGQVDVYLIPGSLYKATISKEGYNTGQSDIIPSPDIQTHTLRLIPEDFDFPDYESFWNDIIIAGSLDDGNLTVTFYDSTGRVTDTEIRAYSLYDDVETLIDTDSRTGETSFTYNVSTNTTRDHLLKLWFNTSATYTISKPISIIIYGWGDSWRDEAKFNLSARFEALFGPFILDYADTICILIALIALTLFGPFHAGIGIITCGLSVLLVQSLFSVHTVNSNAWMFALGVFVLILGLLYMITTNTREMV